MTEIKKIEVDGEVVHLSKTDKPLFAKWHVVYPIKNEDGSINWKHLITGGTWGNLIFALLFVIIFLGAVLEYSHSLHDCSLAMAKLNQYEMKYNPAYVPDNIRKNLALNRSITLEVNNTE